MLPLIIMAAASILSNKQKQDRERQQLVLQSMENQARQLGGHTDVAEVYRQGRNINDQSADYGPLLALVGKGGGDSDVPVADDDGTGDPGIMPHTLPWEDELNKSLNSYDFTRGWR